MLFFFAALGLILGSFGNVLVTRLPQDKSIGGRSRCPGCGRVLRPLQLIPVLSFAAQRGRCTGCKMTISWLYPCLEIASATLFLLAWHLAWAPLPAFLLGCTLWLLLLISIVDLHTHTIPDALNFSLIWAAALFAWTRGSVDPWALLLGVGFLGLQWGASGGKWIGSGDIFLMTALGFIVPTWMHMSLLLGIAYILGAAVALALMLAGKVTRKSHMPFAPFLAAGTLLTLLSGSWLLTLIG